MLLCVLIVTLHTRVLQLRAERIYWDQATVLVCDIIWQLGAGQHTARVGGCSIHTSCMPVLCRSSHVVCACSSRLRLPLWVTSLTE